MATLEYLGGIIFALIATVLFNLAPIVQKDALDRMKDIAFSRPVDSLKALLASRRWLFGFGLGMLGAIPYMAALLWAGPAVVQPLIAFGYIVLVLAARRVLKERLTAAAWTAIAFMIVMPVFIYFSSVSNVAPTMHTIGAQARWAIFTVAVLAAVGLCWMASRKYPVCWAPAAGLLFFLGAVCLTAMLTLLTSAGYRLPGDIATVLANIFSDRNCVLALIAGLLSVAFNVIGTFAVQVGLQKVAASRFTPINQTLNNMVTVIGGLAVFGQTVGNWPVYGTGIALAMAGTFILGRYRMPEGN